LVYSSIDLKKSNRIFYYLDQKLDCSSDGLYPYPGETIFAFDQSIYGSPPIAFNICLNKFIDFNIPYISSTYYFIFLDACSNLYFVCTAGDSYVEVYFYIYNNVPFCLYHIYVSFEFKYCPDNLVFDPVSLKCVAKEDASCTNNWSPRFNPLKNKNKQTILFVSWISHLMKQIDCSRIERIRDSLDVFE
jgi:hypothetical protein